MSDPFEVAVLANLPAMRRHARALTPTAGDADDLLQETLLRVFEKRHLYRDVGVPMEHWLSRVMRNVKVNEFRRQASRPVEVQGTEDLWYAPPAAEAAVLAGEVAAALSLIPGGNLVAMAAIGYGYEELARSEDVPIGTVRSRMSRARTALRLAVGTP